MKVFKIQFLLLLFLCLNAWVSQSQNIKLNSPLAKLAKNSLELNSGKLYFNVLQFHNESNDTVSFDVKLTIPPGWKSLTFLPKTITLMPSQKKLIPVRVRPGRNIIASQVYNVSVMLNDKSFGENMMLKSDVSFKVKHDWNIEVLDKTKYFTSDQNTIDVEYRLNNKGNTKEEIYLTYLMSNEIQINNAKKEIQTVVLESKRDTTIKLSVRCTDIFERIGFNAANLKIIAKSDSTRLVEEIGFVKLKSTFDNFDSNSVSPDNIAGVNFRSSAGQDKPQIGAFVKGQIQQKNNVFINYELSSLGLTGSDDFLRDHQIALNYESEDLKAGLGTSISALGEDLYKKNSLFGDYKIRLGDKNTIYTFANTSINDKNTGLAFGHEYSTKAFSTLNSIAYNANSSQQIFTKSARSNTQLNLEKGILDYQGEYIEAEDKLESISEKNYNHLLRFNTDIGDRFNFHLYNDLLSQNSNKQDYFNNLIQLQGNYNLNDNGLIITGEYARTDYNQNNKDGLEAEGYANLYRLQLALPINRSTRLIVGSKYNQLENKIDDFQKKKTNLYDLFMRANYQKNNISFQTDLKYGVKETHSATREKNPNIEFEGRMINKFSHSGRYTVGLRYTESPLELLEAMGSKKKMLASAGFQQKLFNEKLNIALDGNYDLIASSREENYNLNLSLETQLRKNLGFSIRGSFGPKGNRKKMGLSSVEASMVMGFDSQNRKSAYHSVDVLFFKDKNSNGVYDQGEEAIESVQVSFKRDNLNGDQYQTRAMFIGTSLMSDSKGQVHCKHLPEGGYNLRFQSLRDLNGYFNFEGNNRQFYLKDDKQMQIPFVLASKIYGSLSVKRSNFSSLGQIDLANIKVKVTDAMGREYSTLTDKLGNYTIYVPKNRVYKLYIKNVFGSKLTLDKNNVEVSMLDQDKFMVNFEVKEKKRKINFKRR